jgi:hypothetical protein
MDPLESELRRVLAVDPSPEFLARIRTRVAGEPVRGWFSRALIAPVVLAIAIIAVVAVFLRRPPSAVGNQATAVLAARTITAATLMAPVSAVSRSIVTIASSPPSDAEPHISTASAMHVTESEVLVAGDEMRAVHQLIRDARRGDLSIVPAPVAPPATEITIDPIAIEPIPSLIGTQGAIP